jgi:uncharacterized protein YndB with AHSA1/START domain
MIAVSRSVFIEAPVERVFALIADPLARARLNPDVTPIDVRIEGGAPLTTGSRVHFRLQIGERVVDYQAEVREFLRNRRIVSMAQATVPFEVRLETEALDRGTRLTQTESFEASEELLEAQTPDGGPPPRLPWLGSILLLFYPEQAARLRQEREERLAERLGANMDRWLTAIKRDLERGAGTDAPTP